MLLHDDRGPVSAGPGHVLVSAWLRSLRVGAGIRVRHAAALGGLSDATVTDMETGGIRLVHRDVMSLLNVYRHGGSEPGRAVAALLTDTDTSVRDSAPGWAARLRAAHEQAQAVSSVSVLQVPGPLQVPAYADAVRRSLRRCTGRAPCAPGTARHVPGTYRVFLDEAVLARPFGGPAVMAEQVAHLEKMMTCGVDLRVITLARPCTVLDETRLELSGGQTLHPVEGQLSATYVSPAFAAMHHQVALELLDQRAASPRDTRRLLEDARSRLQQEAAAGEPVSADSQGFHF